MARRFKSFGSKLRGNGDQNPGLAWKEVQEAWGLFSRGGTEMKRSLSGGGERLLGEKKRAVAGVIY